MNRPQRPRRPRSSSVAFLRHQLTHDHARTVIEDDGLEDTRGLVITVDSPTTLASPSIVESNESIYSGLKHANGSQLTIVAESKKIDDGSSSKQAKSPSPFKKPLRFWLIFAALLTVTCLTAVDMTIMSTTLPTIVESLPRSSISGSWVTSSFLLTTTAFQPFMGGLSDVIGRRNALVLSVLLFMGGSVICAEAGTMLVLVIGRGVQGVGGGGVQTIAEIILSDLTSLRERGIFVGLISLVFAVATFIAPVLGGLFSEHDWRWVFWINLPIGFVSLCVIIPTMKLKTPQMPLMAKIHRMDIGANAILLASIVSILIALTDGGILHPWSSWKIWLPFGLGWLGFALFLAVELIPNRLAPDPVLPRRLFANRTAGTCFTMTFVHGLLTYGLIYLLPIYFQAIKSSSPLRSAVELFPATAPGPFSAILAGVLMAVSGKYLAQLWIWWAITLSGCGLLCLLDVNTPTWQWILFQVIPGFGVGALFTLTLPPIQASLPVEELAHATATFAFCRSLGSVWGIALGTNVFISVVNGELAKIPLLSSIGLTGSSALGFATELTKLPMDVQAATRNAYMTGIRFSLFVFCPVALVGLLICACMEELPLPDFNESKHGLNNDEDDDKQRDGKEHPMTLDSPMSGSSAWKASQRPLDGWSEKVPIPQHVPVSTHHLRNRSIHRFSPHPPTMQTVIVESLANTAGHARQAYQSGFAL